MSTSSSSTCSSVRMCPYAEPGLDMVHPPAFPISGPESPSASTDVSSDTNITAPSDLSSETIEEVTSFQPLCSLEESTDRTPSIPRTIEIGRFTRHKRFFFEDGNVKFLVDNVLYHIHRYYLSRDSEVFKTRLLSLLTQDASSLPIISIENVKSKDFDAFLSVLYPLDFNALGGYSFDELSSILDLSTQWGFASIRDMAIRSLELPTPHQRLILGRKFGVDEWILPALQELCEGPEPPTPDEARLMSLEDIILVGSVREKVRTHALTVDSVSIMDRIKSWGSVEPPESVSVLSVPPPFHGAMRSPSPMGSQPASVFGARSMTPEPERCCSPPRPSMGWM